MSLLSMCYVCNGGIYNPNICLFMQTFQNIDIEILISTIIGRSVDWYVSQSFKKSLGALNEMTFLGQLQKIIFLGYMIGLDHYIESK